MKDRRILIMKKARTLIVNAAILLLLFSFSFYSPEVDMFSYDSFVNNVWFFILCTFLLLIFVLSRLPVDIKTWERRPYSMYYNSSIVLICFVIFSFVLQYFLAFHTERVAIKNTPEKEIYTNNKDVSLSLTLVSKPGKILSSDPFKNIPLNQVTPRLLKINRNDSGVLHESYVELVGERNESTYSKEVFLKDLEIDAVRNLSDSKPTKVVQYSETFQRTLGPLTFKSETRTYLKFYFADAEDVQIIQDLID